MIAICPSDLRDTGGIPGNKFEAGGVLTTLMPRRLFEETVLPQTAGQWLAVLGLGLMPVGAAFYAWDFGVKRGNIQVLGAASYASPLLSTLVLVLAGIAAPSLPILAACVLITAGAILAAKQMLFRSRSAAVEAR